MATNLFARGVSLAAISYTEYARVDRKARQIRWLFLDLELYSALCAQVIHAILKFIMREKGKKFLEFVADRLTTVVGLPEGLLYCS